MGDDSEDSPLHANRNGKRRRANYLMDSDSSDSDSSLDVQRKGKRIFKIAASGNSSDSDEPISSISKNKTVFSDESTSSDSDMESANEENTVDVSSSAWESDWASESQDEDEINIKPNVVLPTETAIPSSSKAPAWMSDSSDGQSDKCPICLLSFTKQEVGTPESCDHSFCADCLQEWSRNVNTCPVDRQEFTLILVRKRVDGKVIRQVPVEVRRPSEDDMVEEDPTHCEVCGQCDREDRMLLCDGCDAGYHMECLNPPMEEVPLGQWYCSECVDRNGAVTDEIADDEVHGVREETRRPSGLSVRRRLDQRIIPRTSQSERVRATIQTHRVNQRMVTNVEQFDSEQPSTSSGFESLLEAGTSRPRGSISRASISKTKTRTKRKYKVGKRKTRKNAKHTVEYEICQKTGKKRQINKNIAKRKCKKIKRRNPMKIVKPKTVKKRLADHLGMCPPRKPGQSLPDVKVRQVPGGIGFQRSQAGIPTLHLFGQRDDLDYFSDNESDIEISSGTGNSSVAVVAHRNTMSHIAAARRTSRQKLRVLEPAPMPTNQINLLDSILESQEQWHSRKSKVTVNIDGSLNIQLDKSKGIIKEDNVAKNNNNNATDIGNSDSKKVDVNQNIDSKDVSKVPMYPGHGGGNNRAPYNFQNRGGGSYRGSNNYRGSQDYVGYQGSGNNNHNNQYGSNRGPDQWGNRSGFPDYSYHHPGPQRPRDSQEYRSRNNSRFPRRQNMPSSSSDEQPHSIELSENINNLPAQSSHQSYKEDSEFDIYSDIEPAEQNEEEQNITPIVNNITTLLPPIIQSTVTQESCAIMICESKNSNDSEAKDDVSNNYDPAEPSPDSDDENVSTDVPTISEVDNISYEDSTILENEIYNCRTLVSNDESNSREMDNTTHTTESTIESTLPDVNESPEKSRIDNSTENDNNTTSVIPDNNVTTDVTLSVDEIKKIKTDTDNDQTVSEMIETEVNKTLANSDSDGDGCPNFSIYSATSMDIARPDDILNDPNAPHEIEEDLVQLTGELEENQNANPVSDISTTNASEPTTVCINASSTPPEEESNTENEPAVVMIPELKVIHELKIEVDETNNDAVVPHVLPVVSDILKLETVELKTPPPKVLNLTPSTVKSSGRSQRFPPSKKSVLELYDDSDWEEWNNEKTDEEKTLTKPPSTLAGIEKLTESISDVEDERSYTPCLDENKAKVRPPAQDIFASDEEFPQPTTGIGGLDTELISDEENMFVDDSNVKHTTENKDKVVDDIEINKLKTDDYEEGEIVERVIKSISKNKSSDDDSDSAKKKKNKSSKSDKNAKDKERGKKSEGFKKLNKSGKDRNYRDKDKNDLTKNRDRSKTQDKENEKENKSKTKEPKKREKRKDIERYDVRQIVSERPRKQKDKYGRDTSRQRSMSRSRSRSVLGRSKTRRSRSRRNLSRRRSTSRVHKSRSRQRSRSRRRSRSPRHRFSTHSKSRSRSVNRSKIRPKKVRNIKRRRSRTRSGSVHRNIPRKVGLSESKQQKYKNRSRSKSVNKKSKWNANKRRKRSRSLSKDWSESWSSRSQSPKSPTRGVSPSWTPPVKENTTHNAENLTVILKNKEANKSKKKEKKKKSDKKTKDASLDKYNKKRKRDRSEPQPSKEVFASGDNILVSVSFNKKQSGEDTSSTTSPSKEPLSTKRKHKGDEQESAKKSKNNKSRDKSSKQSGTKKTRRSRIDTTNSKPVAIIDLDKSPFKELTPSPKAVIVLSDSDKEEERQSMLRRDIMEIGSIQGDSQPQSPTNERDSFMNSTGPKTPPEPQIKFCIPLKPQAKLRSINPLHDTEDDGNEIIEDVQDNMRLPEVVHKGPNTPPEPPASPPSSPDAYDPFEPTKSGSQSPEDQIITQSVDSQKNHTSIEGNLDISHVQSVGLNINNGDNISREPDNELVLNSNTVEQVITLLTKKYSKSPERNPIPNTSPHESNSSRANSESGTCAQKSATSQSPDLSKTGVTILSNVLFQPAMLPAVIKPIAPKSSESTLVYSSVAPITSTPIVSNMGAPRVNIFNTPSGSIPPRNIATALPQRVVLPTPLKNSPNKSQSRPSPIKSSPIKPMLSKTIISKLPMPGQKQYIPTKKSLKHMRSSQLNGSDVIDVDMDIESPYSPGSDDYDDLFEPPQMDSKSSQRNMSQNKHNTKSPGKNKSGDAFDTLFGGSSPVYKNKSSSNKKPYNKTVKYKKTPTKGTKTQVGVKMDDDQLKILEDLPSSAVEMQVKDKFLKKLNRQERVVEEVKLVLKPHYNKKHISKEQYKDVLRRAVPKICHNKSGEINPQKIQSLIEAYVKKIRQNKKNAKQ